MGHGQLELYRFVPALTIALAAVLLVEVVFLIVMPLLSRPEPISVRIPIERQAIPGSLRSNDGYPPVRDGEKFREVDSRTRPEPRERSRPRRERHSRVADDRSPVAADAPLTTVEEDASSGGSSVVIPPTSSEEDSGPAPPPSTGQDTSSDGDSTSSGTTGGGSGTTEDPGGSSGGSGSSGGGGGG